MKKKEKSTHQFTKIVYSPRVAVTGFEVWGTVSVMKGRPHIFIGGPTLNALAEGWMTFYGNNLDRSSAQHLIIIECASNETADNDSHDRLI